MTTQEVYAVIGAGHGGKAMAAHLALMGVQVNLYNRTFEHIEVIKKRGGIELDAPDRVPCGLGKLKLVTSDLGEALADAQIVMVVVPSSAHMDIAKASAPYLKNGQIIILHPGRTCGALEFAKVLRDQGCTADVTIAEAETFIYASRSDGPAQARIFRVKEAVPLAALPASRNEQVLESIRCVYPQFIDGVNVLHTGLNKYGSNFPSSVDPAQLGLDRGDTWGLPVLYRWRYTLCCPCAGSAGPRARNSSFVAGDSSPYLSRMAEISLQHGWSGFA